MFTASVLCSWCSRGLCGSTSSSTRSWTWPKRLSSSPPWRRPSGTWKTNRTADPTNHLRESQRQTRGRTCMATGASSFNIKCLCSQERLLDVLCGVDVEHEGCSQHSAHGDVQPAVEAAETVREGRLPEALWTGTINWDHYSFFSFFFYGKYTFLC